MSKRISIQFSDRQMEIIAKIREVDGVATDTAAIGMALAFYSRKVDTAGRSVSIPSIGEKRNMTTEEKAAKNVDMKLAVEKHKQDLKFKEKKNICEVVLGGEVFKDASGGFSCKFSNHFVNEPDEPQILPLDLVNEGYSKHQFFPDRETVFKKKPKLAKLFAKK